jgi:hypothetical protein
MMINGSNNERIRARISVTSDLARCSNFKGYKLQVHVMIMVERKQIEQTEKIVGLFSKIVIFTLNFWGNPKHGQTRNGCFKLVFKFYDVA